ncbi:hypothetical protein [Enterocloster citroniae]|uniref:hypothetical protein n=1 Tax=Enterocloster citroniae TaxID=358743 RepID=UPI00349ECC5A
MLNETVRHIKYGLGKVAEVDQNHIWVSFSGEAGTKLFLYPDAFERFLSFEFQGLQEEALSALAAAGAKKKEEEAMRLFRYKVYEAQRKREQSELLKRRRKAAREKAVREKMPREKAMAEHGGMISVEGQVK